MNCEKNRIVYLNQSRIVGQTFHWHDEQELLIVVEGSIELKVGYEWLVLKEGDIMFINSDEIHCLKETHEKNVVISVYIDCNAIYERYPEFYEIVAIWPYSEAFDKLNKRKTTIMEHVNKLAVMIEKNEEEVIIVRQMDALLKSIIYCYRLDITDPDGAAFQVTDEKRDMIYRTIKYLYSNYDHKVNLQDISEQEYLSMFYLSHKFKDITGYSFRDWLNFVRVEKAEKLLINTSEPITEIAYQCGFSDVRYFNKHFIKWYKISPTQYRQLFKESYEINHDMEMFRENVSMKDIINKIEAIVPEINEAPNTSIDVIVDSDKIKVFKRLDPSWKEKLWCRGSSVLDFRKIQQIKETQKDIGFVSIIIDELFCTELQNVEESSAIEFHTVLNFLLDVFSKIYLVVKCCKDNQYEIDVAAESIQSFLKFYPGGRAAQIEFMIYAEDNDVITIDRIESFVGVLERFGVHYHHKKKYIKSEGELRNHKNDYIGGMIDGEIRIEWLYSKNGFKNNLYYLYFFLSKMGEAVVEVEDDYVITRKREDYQILFHNDGIKLKYPEELQYNLILQNFSGKYKIVRYIWKSEHDDISSIIKNPKVIKHLSDSEYEMINKASIPMISVDYIDCSKIENTCFELNLSMTATSMELILLTHI